MKSQRVPGRQDPVRTGGDRAIAAAGSFALHGHKLTGRFGLTQTGHRQWLLVKASDEYSRPGSDIVAERPASVRSGETWKEVAAEDPSGGE